jgi:tetratricopeptide (TPR) repeat protein
MSNAAKLKKKAAEFEQKKQFDKALQIYIQILDESAGEDDEADVALYNRVGDLLMRQGSSGDAVDYYEKAVDLYAESGFFNNAIALCNKILRQSPGRNSIYYKLGKISAKKGFISDAKQNFLEYADRMQKSGQLDEAFRALKEFADLCPDQDDIRLMLAEQLSKKDRKREAIEQLQTLYEKFIAEGRGAEARATIDRMKAIDPDAEPSSREAVGGQRNDKSRDLVFLDLDDSKAPPAPPPPAAKPAPRPGAARRAAAAAPPPPPEDLEPELEDDLLPLPPLDADEPALADDLDVLEPLDVDDAEVADEVSGLMSTETFSAAAGRTAGQISGFEQTALDTDFDVELPEVLPDLDPPMSGQEFASLDLDDEIEVPHAEPPAHDLALPGKLPSLGRSSMSLTGEMELIIPESDDLPPPRRGNAPAPKAPPAAPARPAASAPKAPPPRMAPPPMPAPKAPPAAPPGPRRVAASALPVEFTPELDASDMAGRDEADNMALPLIGGADSLEVPEDVEEGELPSWMNEGSNGNGHHGANGNGDHGDLPLLDLETPEPRGARQPAAPKRHSHTQLARSVDKLRARVQAEPGNWTLRQQFAEALLEDGERDAGLQELEVVMLGLERSHDLEGARGVADEIIRLNPNSVKHHQKRVEYAFKAGDKPRLADAYIELADALFRAGQAEKAKVVYQRVLELAPTDARAQAALSTFGGAPPAKAPAPRPAAPPVAAPARPVPPSPPRAATPVSVRPAPKRPAAPAESGSDSFVNLSDWLSEEEGPKSTRMVVDEEAPTGDEQADFEEMLRKFKQGVAENVDDEDFESHYDLGVAYKEMGLVDEAIAEFQKALRGSHGRTRTYEALGQCFLEKQQYQVAATILGRSLAEPGSTDDQLVGVLYLLGYASEALRQWGEAVKYYQRVFAVDIQFRDVADRLAALEKVPRR